MKFQEFNSYFYASICRVCAQHPVCEQGLSLLKTCSGCGLISYCCSDHQKIHWRYHKSFCKAVQKLLEKMRIPKLYSKALIDCTFKDWNAIRFNICLLCELELNRKLTASETQMLLFPRVCNVCRIPQAKLLRDCQLCLCVSYCSIEHQEKDKERHLKDCKALKLCLDLDLSHNTFSSICQSFYLLEDITPFDRSIALGSLHNVSFLSKSNMNSLSQVLKSDILSCPMTVAYVASMSLGSIGGYLRVEIVGARQFEISNFSKWEQLIHWFPTVKKLCLSFIGPEIPPEFSTEFLLCELCVGRKVQFDVDMHPGQLYSTFVKERREKPDLIFAFNCGFAEYAGSIQDTWYDSIPLMLQSGSALAITAYTQEEAINDLRCVRNACGDVLVTQECIKNIFGSQRPHRDWEAHEYASNSQVFYKNNFLSIIKAPSSLERT